MADGRWECTQISDNFLLSEFFEVAYGFEYMVCLRTLEKMDLIGSNTKQENTLWLFYSLDFRIHYLIVLII